MTKKYRPIEFGVLTVGAHVDPMVPYHSIVIPPNSDRMSLDYFCKTDCANVLIII